MSKPRRFREVKAGKWTQPNQRYYYMQCCDCGLVHKTEFRVVQGRAQLRAWRANGMTAQVRRKRHITVR